MRLNASGREAALKEAAVDATELGSSPYPGGLRRPGDSGRSGHGGHADLAPECSRNPSTQEDAVAEARRRKQTKGGGGRVGPGPGLGARTPGQVRGASRGDFGRCLQAGTGKGTGTGTGRRAEDRDANGDGNGDRAQGRAQSAEAQRRGRRRSRRRLSGAPCGNQRRHPTPHIAESGPRASESAAPDVSAARWDRTYKKQNPRGRSRRLFGSETKWSPAGAAWAPSGASPDAAGVPGGLEVLPCVSMPPVFVSLSLLCGNVLFKGDNGEPRNNTGEITQPWSARPSSRFIIRKQNTQLQYK
ncbi:uncharacterized protein LOC134759870 [Pongo abelii]|uniref:uncharacterized protein LOC134759870 n=1 Tax=Pongo abelii TaxID=9601 RepID=UPI0030058F54